MTAKRFTFADGFKIVAIRDNGEIMNSRQVCEKLNELYEENKELKLQNEELLYQIGRVGKNNKTCQECECFVPEFKYCYMWDMEVEADEVVVACDQRNVKNIKEMMSND